MIALDGRYLVVGSAHEVMRSSWISSGRRNIQPAPCVLQAALKLLGPTEASGSFLHVTSPLQCDGI
jgi:hypothetical protein